MKITEKQLKSVIKELIEESLIEEDVSSAANVAGTIIKDVYQPEGKKLKLNKTDIAKYIKMYNDPMYIPKLVKIGEDFVKKLIAYNDDGVVSEQLANDILAAIGGIAGFVDVAAQERMKLKSIIETLKTEQDKLHDKETEQDGGKEAKIQELQDEIDELENE